MSGDSLEKRAGRAMREWKAPEARRIREADEREALADGRWTRRRRAVTDQVDTDTLPATKSRRASGQRTAVARGSQWLLTPTVHYVTN